MVIAFRAAGTAVTTGTRSTTTINVPAGTATDDVILMYVNAGHAGSTAPVITAPGTVTLVATTTYGDGIDGWSVRLSIYRYVVPASSPATSFAFTHASASSDGQTFGYTEVDTTTPIDVTPSTNKGTTGSALALSISTVTADTFLQAIRGSWDGNAITPPSGWTERADRPIDWVGDRAQAATGATGDVTIASGNGGNSPWGAILVALRPAGGVVTTGTLVASTPGLTVGPPTAAISGTVGVPSYSGSVAASTPTVTVGPPTAAISGTVTAPTWTGDLDASTPTVTVGPPTMAASGTTGSPLFTGTLVADLPPVTVGPPTMAAAGVIAPPTYSGDLNASVPSLTVGPPTMAASGAFTLPGEGVLVASLPEVTVGPPTVNVAGVVAAPTYAGSVLADLPTVTVGPPSVAAAGVVTGAAFSGTLVADLPTVVVGPPTFAATGTTSPVGPVIPPLDPARTVTVARESRVPVVQAERRIVPVSAEDL